MQKFFELVAFFSLSLGASMALTACSRTSSTPPSSPAHVPPPTPYAEKSAASPSPSPAEIAALDLVRQKVEEPTTADPKSETLLRNFEFTSQPALRAIERFIIEQARTGLPGNDIKDTKGTRRFFADLFWNRVAATELAPDPASARSEMRP